MVNEIATTSGWWGMLVILVILLLFHVVVPLVKHLVVWWIQHLAALRKAVLLLDGMEQRLGALEVLAGQHNDVQTQVLERLNARTRTPRRGPREE